MKFRKLVYAEEYEKGGEKKTAWKECGVLFFNENGNISIKLTSLPLSGQIMAFGPRPKSETPDGKGERYEDKTTEMGTVEDLAKNKTKEEIIDDLPF